MKVNACSTKRGPGVQVQLISSYPDKANKRLFVGLGGGGGYLLILYEYHLNIKKYCFAVKHF